MYTEKSVKLKKDFYSRYGETRGTLYFEKTGLGCVLLDGDTHKLMFSLDCGVRAYGRGYGDVLKVMDAQSNVCDIHFVQNGKGAQILYYSDIPELKGTKETVLYTINKILVRMGNPDGMTDKFENSYLCDKFAPRGWCVVKINDEVKSDPFPMSDYNVLLIRCRKNVLINRLESRNRFYEGEKERIKIAHEALKKCKIDVLLDMINESQKSIERLLSPSTELVGAVHSTYGIDGVDATRICDCGVISFCKKTKTDNAIKCILSESERVLGYKVDIHVVK